MMRSCGREWNCNLAGFFEGWDFFRGQGHWHEKAAMIGPAFTLTPALALRERENDLARSDDRWRFLFSMPPEPPKGGTTNPKAQNSILPAEKDW